MCLAQGPQRSDAGEARTRGPSVSSQALNHWAIEDSLNIFPATDDIVLCLLASQSLAQTECQSWSGSKPFAL